MNEAETRAEYVDPALKAARWGVVEGSRILREYPITLGRIEGHGKRAKPEIADYVLVYRNHKLQAEQIAYADSGAQVEKVGYYHGGDVLYWLPGIPGVWHERCLRPPE